MRQGLPIVLLLLMFILNCQRLPGSQYAQPQSIPGLKMPGVLEFDDMRAKIGSAFTMEPSATSASNDPLAALRAEEQALVMRNLETRITFLRDAVQADGERNGRLKLVSNALVIVLMVNIVGLALLGATLKSGNKKSTGQTSDPPGDSIS